MKREMLRNFILPILGALDANGSLMNIEIREGMATITPISAAAAPISDRNSGNMGVIMFIPSQKENDATVSISTTGFMVKTILNIFILY